MDDMKCKYCTYKGPISSLRQHVRKKRDCNTKYTPDELLEIEKIFESSKKVKRKISQANYYQKNKKPKGAKVIIIT